MTTINEGSQHSTPRTDTTYVPPRLYEGMIWDRDVMAPMRDGVRLCADVYRPRAEGKFPALLAIAGHNKDLQTPELANALPPQPAWSTVWQGGSEAGDSDYLTSRGYVHVVANPGALGNQRTAVPRSGISTI